MEESLKIWMEKELKIRRERIENLAAKLDNVRNNYASLFLDYNEKCRDIESLEKDLKLLKKQIKDIYEDVKAKIIDWKDTFNDVVSKLDELGSCL